MKFYTVLGLLLFLPMTAFAEAAYVVVLCNSSSLTTTQRTICNGGTSYACNSSSSSVAPNSTYFICAATNVGTVSSTSGTKAIVCFDSATTCKAMATPTCASGYAGSTPYIKLSGANVTTGSARQIYNTAEFTCCKTCVEQESDWVAYGDLGDRQRYSPKKCSDTGACAASGSMPYIRCAAGYFEKSGVSRWLVNGSSGRECVKCPTESGGVAVSSPAGAAYESQCYAVANSSSTGDKSGTYQFTQNCPY